MTFEHDGDADHDEVLAAIRKRVDAWRGFALAPAKDPSPAEGRYEPVASGERALTATSLELLRHWFRVEPHESVVGADLFKYWPHQRRAVETFIYLHEVCDVRRAEDLWALVDFSPSWTQRDPWPKLGAQLATGAGKTKVMSLLIAWAYLNAVREVDAGLGLGQHILLVAPGLFVRDRLLQDFLPSEAGAPSVFVADPVVPPSMESDWNLSVYGPDTCPRSLDPSKGALVVTNVHQLQRRSDPAKGVLPSGPRQISILFEEDDPKKLEAVDVPLIERFRRSRGVFVLNDEAHHVGDEPAHEEYEARAAAADAKLDDDAETSMAWIGALRRLNGAKGDNGRIGLQVDLSATLFAERGGMRKGAKRASAKGKEAAAPVKPALFRHTAMRYELVEARSEDIVKRPALERVAARKVGTGESEPLVDVGAANAWERYRHLLAAGIQRWVELRDRRAGHGLRNPILFIVCPDRTEAAEVANYLRYGTASKEDLAGQPLRGYEDPKTKETLFVHERTDGVRESTVLEVHIGKKEQANEADWAKVRARVNAVDKDFVADPSGARDVYGNAVMIPNRTEVVVSVMMLKEGWDVRNVEVIVPLRPCDSRTLTEQILGRGLRKVHPPLIREDGSAELSNERLYVIEHPSFAAIIDQIQDLVDTTSADEPSPPPDYVTIEPRPEDADLRDVRLVRYDGNIEVLREWHDTVSIASLPALQPRRPWKGTVDDTEITTTIEEARVAGREFGLQFRVSDKLSYRDFDHVLEAVYVLPLLSKLQKARHHLTAVKSAVRGYLEQRAFDLPAGVPLSFGATMDLDSARIAMANMARRDVSENVIACLLPILREAMQQRLPSTQALLTVRHSADVRPYQARKVNLYQAPTRSAFNCVAMDSSDEVQVAALLDRCADVEGWVFNHRKLAYFIEYEWRGRVAKYIPDFVVRAKIGNVEHCILLEVKGRFDDQDKAKARRGESYARQLRDAEGKPWHYVFLIENAAHGRKDLTWWASKSVPSVADLLRRHELLPLYPTQQVSKGELALAATVSTEDQFVRALPVYDLVAAAGGFSASQTPEALGWLSLGPDHRIDRECFVARMKGRSMERADGDGIPNGAWVMFRRWGFGTPPLVALDGRRVLVQSLGIADPETGGQYTVKRIRVVSVDSEGMVGAIELRSDNPEFTAIAVTEALGEIRVIAEVLSVVG